jgi:Ca-activated chloride channel homolog
MGDTRMANRTTARLVLVLMALIVVLTACDAIAAGGEKTTIRIVSGSENETLEPLIQAWAQDNNAVVEMTYLGSLDIAQMLRTGSVPYDGVWPANRLWLDYGDTQNLTRHDASIFRSPVVFGLKKPMAEALGWVGQDITMDDILNATDDGSIRFMMTSATQSNSGASFYMGALNAFAGTGEALTSDDLADETVRDKITRILGAVDRSSGSSGWLKDLFLGEYQRFDGMINYEAVIIETNQALVRQGRDPLYAIYPVDGLAIADSPLAYVDHGDEAKERAFLALQQYLLSEPVQEDLLRYGRRANFLGINLSNADPNVFNPAWGIDVERVIQPMPLPSSDVIGEALVAYQIAFRKPSCTSYVLDFSGSMNGEGEEQLKAAMRTLLDQNIASQYLLQGHPGDLTAIYLFNESLINADDLDAWRVRGNDPAELLALYRRIDAQRTGGDTNVFDTVRAALADMDDLRTDECLPAIIVMSDGQDNRGSDINLENAIRRSENDIPVFSILFGNAVKEQLEPMALLTNGRIFDGRADLVDAFRKAKGYN